MKNHLSVLLVFFAGSCLYAQSPGGVNTNLALWNKANLGVTVSGSTVTGWTDQTATNTFTVNGSPTLDATALNYNPGITLGSCRFTGNSSITNITHAILVGRFWNASGSTGQGALLGITGTTARYFFNAQGFPRHFTCSDGTATTDKQNYGTNAISYSILAENLKRSPGSSDLMRQNGLNLSNDGGGDPAPFSGTPVLGGRNAENAPSSSGLAECIIYTDSITPAQLQQVESYLAIKYGFTLSNSGGGTNGDYISSGGTTIWDANDGSGYHNNVFGIARDDNSAFLQKQSHQSDDSARIYLNTLAASNSTNAGSFSSNGQFVMMGTNAARMYNNPTSTETPSGYIFASRFDREWKITNTAFTGTFSIDIKPEAGVYDASKLRVLIDDDGDFTNAGVYTPAISYSGGIITISGMSTAQIPANSTRYLTLVSIAAPGGVYTGLSLWNKANTGVTVAGSNVTEWIDQTTTNTFSITGTPVLQSAPLNYNPTVLFNGSSHFAGNTNINNITQAFAVGKIASGGNGTGAMIGTTTTYGSSSAQYFFHTESNNVYSAGNTIGVFTGFANGGNSIGYSILSEDLGKAPAASDVMRVNGANRSNSVGGDPAIITSAVPGIGLRMSVATIQNISSASEVAEAILYNASLSAADVNKVESYLAIKYGTTLSNSGAGTNGDYTSSSGALVWDASDNSGYHNNVIGIARDDNSGFQQKQSHQSDDSTRLYINTLAASNAVNSGSFSGDGEFVMMGNDNGKLNKYARNAEIPSGQGIVSRIDREWKITNTNFSGTFSMDVKLNASAPNPSDLRILVDDDGDFTNATLFNPTFSYSAGVVTISGISNAMIAANSTKYLTIVSMNAATTLPVELLSFTASPVDNKWALLNWQTASEYNNAYFGIERSANGVAWTGITKVKGAGNATQPVSYAYTDKSPLAGTSYYRLKQTDVDGKSSLSAVKSVTIDLSFKNKVVIYPNPAISQVTIEGDKDEISVVNVYDATGRDLTPMVKVNTVTATRSVMNLTSLTSGIYVVKTKTGSVTIRKQ